MHTRCLQFLKTCSAESAQHDHVFTRTKSNRLIPPHLTTKICRRNSKPRGVPHVTTAICRHNCDPRSQSRQPSRIRPRTSPQRCKPQTKITHPTYHSRTKHAPKISGDPPALRLPQSRMHTEVRICEAPRRSR